MSNSLTDRHSFSYDELIQCGKGELFGPGNAQLPEPPMLMMDRITDVSASNPRTESNVTVVRSPIIAAQAKPSASYQRDNGH